MRKISTTVTIDAPPPAVWEHLVDFPSHADWNPFFSSIEGEAVEGTQLRVTARKGEGTGMRFTPTVLEVRPARALRWKGKLLVGGIFDGEHYFELAPAIQGGTTLTQGEIFTGVLIPFMGKVLAETEEGFRAFNLALKERAEAATIAS